MIKGLHFVRKPLANGATRWYVHAWRGGGGATSGSPEWQALAALTRKTWGSQANGVRRAALTGLRRQDLVTLAWDQVGDHSIQKKALKISRRKRRHATVPRIPQLSALLAELRTRVRRDGVNTVLINSYGQSWSGDGFGGSFNRIRDAAAIIHSDPETGEQKRKHLHDVRGTFCTKLALANVTDQEAAGIMGWSPEQVAGIRRVYVDQTRIVVAIGERIAKAL